MEIHAGGGQDVVEPVYLVSLLREVLGVRYGVELDRLEVVGFDFEERVFYPARLVDDPPRLKEDVVVAFVVFVIIDEDDSDESLPLVNEADVLRLVVFDDGHVAHVLVHRHLERPKAFGEGIWHLLLVDQHLEVVLLYYGFQGLGDPLIRRLRRKIAYDVDERVDYVMREVVVDALYPAFLGGKRPEPVLGVPVVYRVVREPLGVLVCVIVEQFALVSDIPDFALLYLRLLDFVVVRDEIEAVARRVVRQMLYFEELEYAFPDPIQYVHIYQSILYIPFGIF